MSSSGEDDRRTPVKAKIAELAEKQLEKPPETQTESGEDFQMPSLENDDEDMAFRSISDAASVSKECL